MTKKPLPALIPVSYTHLEEDELQGVITVKDIATANMDLFDTGILAKSRTSYRNICLLYTSCRKATSRAWAR